MNYPIIQTLWILMAIATPAQAMDSPFYSGTSALALRTMEVPGIPALAPANPAADLARQQEQRMQAYYAAYINNPLVDPLAQYQTAHWVNRIHADATAQRTAHEPQPVSAKYALEKRLLAKYESMQERGEAHLLNKQLCAVKKKLCMTFAPSNIRSLQAQIAGMYAILKEPKTELAFNARYLPLPDALNLLEEYKRAYERYSHLLSDFIIIRTAIEFRPDYQQKMEYTMAEYHRQLHQAGDLPRLRCEHTQLMLNKAACKSESYKAQLQRQLGSLEKRLNDEMTKSLDRIKTADLATAKAEYARLIEDDNNKPTTYKNGGPLKIGHPRDYIHNYGFNHLQAAKTILELRSDYRQEQLALSTAQLEHDALTLDMVSTSMSQNEVSTQVHVIEDVPSLTSEALTVPEGPIEPQPSTAASCAVTNDTLTDFVSSYAYDDRVNISKDVDQRISQMLDTIHPHDYEDFSAYLNQIDTVLDGMRQRGELEPAQQRNLLARFVRRFFTTLNPITQIKELPSALFHITMLLAEVCSIDAPGEQTDGMMFELVNEDARLARSIEILDSFDLSLLTDEQWTDIGADIFAGIVTGIGIEKARTIIQTMGIINTVKNSTQPARLAAKKLIERIKSFVRPVEKSIATTAEGVPVSIAQAAEETMSLQNAAQKVGSGAKALTSKEIANQIAENTHEILMAIREPLEDLIKNGTKIKKIYDYNKIRISHIFSQKHIEDGILSIGKTEYGIINEFIKVIKKVDALGQLKEGTTNIMTYVNNIPIEIRPFMKGDMLMGFDAFVGHSPRGLLDCVRI